MSVNKTFSPAQVLTSQPLHPDHHHPQHEQRPGGSTWVWRTTRQATLPDGFGSRQSRQRHQHLRRQGADTPFPGRRPSNSPAAD
ncbi:MAG: hypothetical protein MZV64_24385 [Ignavibacteriales bacterium]|nr:hypothetical protein [Ignavibacteriales bacterium]